MINIVKSNLASIIEQLNDSISDNWVYPSPDSGFLLYAFNMCNMEYHYSYNEINDYSIFETRISEAPILASLGYFIATEKIDDEHLKQCWLQGFKRLSARDPFYVDRNTFFYRPLELLGICLGANYYHSLCPEEYNWLIKTISEGEKKLKNSDYWSYTLSAYAAHIIGINWGKAHLDKPDSLNLNEFCLNVWINSIDPIFAQEHGHSLFKEEFQSRIFNYVLKNNIEISDLARTAMLFSSLNELYKLIIESNLLTLSKTNVYELITYVLRKFDIFARQLAQEYRENRLPFKIKDEYDVQYLLHALLKLHFSDVRPEEFTPSYGGKNSRTDFLLKREKIFIEAKMTNANLKQKKVVEQLIIDKEQYRKTHPDCKALICFVYDPENHCNNPEAIENDLSEDDGNFNTIVIVSSNI